MWPVSSPIPTRQGNDVVVVLSAQGDTTDDLIEKAAEINPKASKREMDMLLSTGEQISMRPVRHGHRGHGLPGGLPDRLAGGHAHQLHL